jgi:hypothetical protein
MSRFVPDSGTFPMIAVTDTVNERQSEKAQKPWGEP